MKRPRLADGANLKILSYGTHLCVLVAKIGNLVVKSNRFGRFFHLADRYTVEI